MSQRDLKLCACGKEFARNRKYGRQQWEKASFCSAACANKARATHGMRETRLYRIWAGIKTRCRNTNDPIYAHYGARGIIICDDWAENFEAFAKHMGGDHGSEYQVGRIDNDVGYIPGNVRWETRSQNMRNKRDTRWVELSGETMPLVAACERTGVPYKRAHARLRAGWAIEEAIKP